MNHAWPRIPLNQLVIKVGSGATPKGGNATYQQSGIPFIRSMNVVFFGFKREGIAYLSPEQADALRNVEVRANDVLLNITGASIGRVTVAPFDMDGARVNQHVCIIRPNNALTPRYLSAYLSGPEMQDRIWADNYGVTRQALTKQQILSFEIPLPSFNEQKRIADKLDRVLARVDACRDRLDRLPVLLKRFRQSVLAAATSGALTEDWRNLNLCIDSSKYHAALSHFRDEQLSLLPIEWKWVEFSEVATVASDLRNPSEYKSAIHLAPNHIESGTGRISGCLTIEEDKVISPKHKFRAGQIVYSKIRPNLCKVAIPNFDGLCSADMYPINTSLAPSYLYFWMLSERFTDWASNGESRTVLPKINKAQLYQIPVPVAPLPEQHEIVRRVETLFAFADRLEARLNAARGQVERLTPALLAKAFRGELVPQDPADEPAAELLKRLAAQRAAEPAGGKRRQRSA